MRKPYTSDITRKQFELIKDDLESVKKVAKPRDIDIYEVFCAILYRLKNGCSWRNLPHDFPNCEIVYYYRKIWSQNGYDAWKKLLASKST